jgi:membrane protein
VATDPRLPVGRDHEIGHDGWVKIVDATIDAWYASVGFGRRKSRAFDHFWRARQRYNEELGGRLAAAIAYYAFFATFALALVAYSVVGYVLASNTKAVDAVNSFLQQNIPFLDAGQIASSRNTVAVVGLIGLVFTGVGWIESMRSAQRAIWDLDQQPGNLIIRRLVDLGIMVAIGLLLALSLWIQNGIKNAVTPLGLLLSPTVTSVSAQDRIETAARIVGVVLSLLLNCFLAVSLLAGVARLRMSFLRLLPSMLLVAIGLFVLSTVGRIYIDYSSNRPAYQVVGGTVALLLFLYLFSQLLLYGAALAATSRRGTIVDLAAGPPPGDEALDRRAIDAARVLRR